jgi:hypothetical protein
MNSKKISILFLFILIAQIATTASASSKSEPDSDIKKSFLFSNSSWLGDFQNYVNRNAGTVQSGKIQVELTTSNDTIIMKNIFLNDEGEPTDYTGYSYMIVKGDSIISADESGVDENTGNEIIDYNYSGRILDNHIYIHESYKEILPNGEIEQRSSSVHYYLISKNEIIQLAEVWVDNSLLVFAGTQLKRQD